MISRRHLLRASGAAPLAALLAPACAPERREPVTADGRFPIMAILEDTPELSRFVLLLERSGLAETLRGDGPFTVFAPTNAAWAAAPPEAGGGTGTAVSADPQRLAAVLRGLIARGRLSRADIAARDGQIVTLDGGRLRVAPGGQQVARVAAGATPAAASARAAGSGPAATITRPDLRATNGVIHVIDRVLL
ncbi:fasciclin domain-containing protein [Caldovatus aquaticus]|uniref:Fasciclin domain-containing protein n=1 Tax=Caldovatus aquaticus TaxID=2865671 RepID=A0ABS7F6D5_9PROT|nr:fasciclin domain-containing protein [Caldovatus aquaticus]